MNYRSLEDMNRVITRHLHRIPPDIRLVVGIPRSGLLAANLLALHLNLPLTDIDGLLAGRLIQGGTRSGLFSIDEVLRGDGRVLVMDDSICTGDAMSKTRRALAPLAPRVSMIFGAVFSAPDSPNLTNLNLEVVPVPRIFEWNALHHGVLRRSCVDIDGVLCADPTPRQNDDGGQYRRFLERTPPRVRPREEIGWLVTARLERYRQETEGWLRGHGIRYRELVMLDLPDRATRQHLNAAASFKARVYRETRADLFIESDPAHAAAIAHLSAQDVYCVGSGRLVKPDHLSRLHSSMRTQLGRAHWRLRHALGRWRQPYISAAHRHLGGAS